MLRWSLVYVFAVLFLMAAAAAGWMLFSTRQAVREIESLEATLQQQRQKQDDIRAKLRQALSDRQNAITKLRDAETKLEEEQTGRRDAEAKLAKTTALNKGLKLQIVNSAPVSRGLLSGLSKAAKEVAKVTSQTKEPAAGTTGKTRKTAANSTSKTALAKVQAILAQRQNQPGAASAATQSAIAAAKIEGERTITRSLNMRAGPSTKTKLLVTLRPGRKITVTTTGAAAGWHKVVGPPGLKGYIKTTVLSANSK